MHQRKKAAHDFHYAPLERRQLLAGDVFARFSSGDLIVVGDSQANTFSINANAATADALVQGQDGTNVRFASTFDSDFASTDINNIRVYGNGGNDTVTIDARNSSRVGALIASLGAGDDSLYIEGGNFSGGATIYGGTSDDSIFIDQTRFGDNLTLMAGSATDTVALNGITVTGVTRFLGQGGTDALLVNDSTFQQNMYVELGSGDDRFETVNSTYNGRISVRGRIDYDVVALDDSNNFSNTPNLQTIEVEASRPNANGAAEAFIDQFASQFLETGSELRSYTANSLQDGMSEFAAVFDATLFELQLEPVSQTVSVLDPTQTISVIWDGAVQNAITATGSGPTIASRAYAMMHTAMFDAWSAYDVIATSTVLGDTLQRPANENTLQNKETAMSFAAYRVLEDLFANQAGDFEALMVELGLNPNNSLSNNSAAGIGNQMAAALLLARHQDGSNQLGDSSSGTLGVPYSDTTGYEAPNPVSDSINIDLWSPEFVPIDSTPEDGASVQQFLTPQWGQVEAFALVSGDQFQPDAPQPFLLVDDALVDLDAKTITYNNQVFTINESLVGSLINPEFIAQAEEIVEISGNLTDEEKLIAEFWEDGGGTSFPPGTTMTFGQFVSARDNHSVDQDAKLFFALANSQLDSGIAAWESKVAFDYTRPVRAIRELGELGLIGEYHAELGGYAIDAWTPTGGTQTILAADFVSYQDPLGEASPPFAEYVSGHSTFSAAGATILELFTGSDAFNASVTFDTGTSRFETGITPSSPLTLSWDSFSEAADESGISRLYGGIHFTEGNVNGLALGDEIGAAVWAKAQGYIYGTTYVTV